MRLHFPSRKRNCVCCFVNNIRKIDTFFNDGIYTRDRKQINLHISQILWFFSSLTLHTMNFSLPRFFSQLEKKNPFFLFYAPSGIMFWKLAIFKLYIFFFTGDTLHTPVFWPAFYTLLGCVPDDRNKFLVKYRLYCFMYYVHKFNYSIEFFFWLTKIFSWNQIWINGA